MSSRAIFIIAAIVAVTGTAETADDQVLFKSDFESAHVDWLPEELMVLAGEFSIKDIDESRRSSSPATHSKTRCDCSDRRNPMASPCGRAFIPKAPAARTRFGVGFDSVAGYRFSSRPAKISSDYSRTKRRGLCPTRMEVGTSTWLISDSRGVGGKWIIEGRASPNGSRSRRVVNIL